MRSAVSRAREDRGSAVVDFVLIGSLVVVLFLALIQLGLALHVRSTATSAASEGARVGARADRTPADGAKRTTALLTQSVSSAYAGQVDAHATVIDGLDVIEVKVIMPLPVIGLIGPAGSVTVLGHALVEPQ